MQNESATATRRDFLKTAAIAAASGLTTGSALATPTAPGELSGRIQKAVKYHMITEEISAIDKLKMLKDLGFDGVEPRTMLKPSQTAEVKELARASESVDLPIHGVVNSNNPDIISAINQAKLYGATSVLHVVEDRPDLGYVENYRRTQDIIRRAVDHASKNEVSILVENVWKSHLIEPLGMARFIDEINSPWVQVYFDVGNVVRWGYPHHWLEVLGSRAKKLDIKEFDLNIAMKEGMRKAFQVPIGEGSVDWAKIRAELLKIDYRGWATAEVPGGDRKRLAEIAEQMDRALGL